jgi:hypothetical protein
MVTTRLHDELAAPNVPSSASGWQPGWSALILSPANLWCPPAACRIALGLA